MQTKPVIKSSAFLFGFYTAYAAWVDGGGSPIDFVRNRGLCANLFDYCKYRDEPPECHLEDMHRQFLFAGLDMFLPFNPDSFHYKRERDSFSCHLNQRRIAWVRERVKDSEASDIDSQRDREAVQ